MGRPLEQSLMALAYSQVNNSPGSPYLQVYCQIKAGAILYNPLKITKVVLGMDFVRNCSDELYIYVAIPSGDVMRYISPFQDDLSITLRVVGLSSGNQELEDEKYLTRTFRAYLEDQVKSPIDSSNTLNQPNADMANLADIKIVSFRLEEIGVEQLRMIRTGTTVRDGCPMIVADAMLRQYAKSIQLDDDEKITGPSVDEGYNTTSESTITIPDGTPLLDLPDLLQNELGGIYKEALGFYIRNNHIHLWPLYKLDRQDTAKRVLRVYVAPDPRSNVVEHSWRVPPDSPEVVEIWVGGNIDVVDNTVAEMHQFGTAVRNVDPRRVMNGFSVADKNVLSVNASDNNMSFKGSSLITGRQIVRTTETTANPYLIMSRLAKSQGIEITVVWNHSLPTILIPGMAVELVYDYYGEIRTVYGTLLEALSSIDSLGTGLVTQRFQSTTALKVFVPREDFIYEAWVEDEGAIEASTLPERNNLYE